MIVSWNWLTQYVRIKVPHEQLTERLALTGLNHEWTKDVNVTSGTDLAIDLEVTSNRSDCLGHLGIAREISVVFDWPLHVPDPRPATSGATVETLTSVTVDAPELCPRFTARLVRDVKVGESPRWLRSRLEAIGVRPVSNVVDVTNYVMFENGQPLHAYDFDKLAGKRLVVRKARPGEKIAAINNKVYELTSDMLAIADAERPVGLAGVMGGLETEISPATRNVLIEAAQFDAMSVRRTSRALGLFSPSSYRFERPLDPEGTEWASRRCAELVLETAGGSLHPGVIDVATPRRDRPTIRLRLDQIPRLLGIEIGREEVDRILRALGLCATGEADGMLEFQPPSWRSDLEREIDLIEEVARIHGYEHIPENRAVPLTSTPRGARERVENATRESLTACGLDEAVTFSLVSDELSVPLGHGHPPVRVEHQSRRREGALRQSLVPSLLAARAHNEAHGEANAELFEIANVYLPRPGQELPDEPTRLAIVSGRDFAGLKGVVEALLARLHLAEGLEVIPVELPAFVAGRAAELRLSGTHLGYLGEVEGGRLADLGLRGSASSAELEFAVLVDRAVLVPRHRRLPPFPTVTRDLSLVVDRALTWAELSSAVAEAAGPTLEAVEYLDTFRGGNLPPERQSVHFGLRFRHPDRTLTGDEVELAVKSAVDSCARRFSAVLRG
ncbi:MAG: phenylalanine--tRNA ligase subunit beta [Isosphaeraceae bacterium]